MLVLSEVGRVRLRCLSRQSVCVGAVVFQSFRWTNQGQHLLLAVNGSAGKTQDDGMRLRLADHP